MSTVIEKICTAKETINKMKRQPTEWEKIFAYDISDKRLMPRTDITQQLKSKTIQLKSGQST